MPCGPASISQRFEESCHLPTQDQAVQELDCLYLTMEETLSFYTSELLVERQRVSSENLNLQAESRLKNWNLAVRFLGVDNGTGSSTIE
jgi:hypothetical protein